MKGILAAATRALLAAALLATGCRPKAPRVQPLPPEAFRVEWSAPSLTPVLRAGETREIAVTFRNASPVVWPDPGSTGGETAGSGAGAVRLAYRWWSSDAPIPVVDYAERTDLSRPLRPGESATLAVRVTVPRAPGEYELQFDLCQELVTWFEPKRAKSLIVPVRVEPAGR
jgi:hypothetical protein